MKQKQVRNISIALFSLATQMASMSLALADSACDHAHAQFQSDLFLTSSGGQKIVTMQVENELGSIDQDIQSTAATSININDPSLDSISVSNIHIVSATLGNPVVKCQGPACDITLPVKKLQLQANANVTGLVPAGPANNVTITLGSPAPGGALSSFTMHAQISNDPLHPFTISQDGSNFKLGAQSLTIHAPTQGAQASGDGVGAADLVNALGEIISADNTKQSAFNQLVSSQITSAILPPISARVNAVLTQLPLFGKDVSVKTTSMPGMSAVSSTMPDIELRITAAEYDRTQKTMDYLLSACVACLQDQTAGPATPTWPSTPGANGQAAPAASTYDAAVGLPYSTINNALSDAQQTGALNSICLGADGKSTGCPVAGQSLARGETEINLTSTPNVGYDPGHGFYVNIPSIAFHGLPTVGALSGRLKVYVDLATTNNGTQITLKNPRIDQNFSVIGNGFIVNHVLNGLMGYIAPKVSSTLISKIQNTTLVTMPGGIKLNEILPDASGLRAYADFDTNSPTMQAILN
jgi:hypothetical protein